MKKLAIGLLAVIFFIACKKNSNPDANLHIKGNIKGLAQGKLYIQKVVDTTLVALDTIVINGKSSFESHLKLDSPEMLFLFLDRGQTNSIDNNLPFFAEPGNMKIETTNDEFFAKAKISGSENHKIYEEFLKVKNRFTNQNIELVEKNLRAIKKSDTKLIDSIQKQSDDLTKRRYLYTVNFALNNAKHEVAPYLALSEIYDANIKYLDTIQKSMTPKIAQSHYGKMLTQFVAERNKQELN